MVCAALIAGSGGTMLGQPVVDVSDTQVVEGNSGTTNAEFVITLSAPQTNDVTVAYTTFEVPYDYLNQPYPAHSGADFIATNGAITFAPGETNKSVFVQVIGDTVNEANEPFGLGLTLQGPGTLTHSSARCLILDDDPLEIYLNPTSALEGSSGNAGLLPCSVTTFQQTEQFVYGLSYAANGTATAGNDYYGGSPLRWTLDPGPPRTETVGYVPLIGDDINEDDETVLISGGLGIGRFDTNPQNARGVVFLNQNVECTIINDDFYLSTQTLSSNRTQLSLFGAMNATHILQSSSDLVNWTSFSTNTLDTTRQANVTVTNSGYRFYRALRIANVSQ